MRIVSVALISVLALSAIISLYGGSTSAFHPSSYLMYEVLRGDTLWAIATKFGPPHLDRRTYIYHVRKLNDLMDSANIVPGQVLRLPMR
ncbi:MAG: Cell division suppressor protein YneA [Firmicutes bacterium]|nr:Cell division suppressor protein YneA [candidate division NPL-UPA2 bacterium]